MEALRYSGLRRPVLVSTVTGPAAAVIMHIRDKIQRLPRGNNQINIRKKVPAALPGIRAVPCPAYFSDFGQIGNIWKSADRA